MKVIILCGGIGSRMNDYSFPKPLNMIYGRPAISYVLENLPENIIDLYFIYGKHLKNYNFEETIINLFKRKICHFHVLDYFTRGPVETAYIGTCSFKKDNESIVFLDNDNIYTFPDNFFIDKPTHFLGGATDTSGTSSFSFISHKNGKVIDIVEKRRISETYCCGVYGFKNVTEFQKYAKILLTSNLKLEKNEIYMSDIYKYILNDNVQVDIIKFENQGNHIGSLVELETSLKNITIPKMRICFDLDNTLVSYPVVPGDYSTVSPIYDTINIAKKLHDDGHTIIIHTARRMETHKHNIGAVLRDIGKVTFETLEKFKIPYDEIIFGKPIADVYIDDRSINPYMSKYTSMGLFYRQTSNDIINKLPTNKHNSINLNGSSIIKRGPVETICGELHSYKVLQNIKEIRDFFPKFYSYSENEECSTLEIEYIKGIPYYILLKHELIGSQHILNLFEMLNIFHSVSGKIEITKNDVICNYIDKLTNRFSNKDNYPFKNVEEIKNKILKKLNKYTSVKIVPFIHGDLWFSNIILGFDQKVKCFDMRGRVNNILTTNGDILYDYAKLYQSLLGFDAALYGDEIGFNYLCNIRKIFEENLILIGLSLSDLKIVTISLISGTLYAIDSYDAKLRVWNLVCKYINDELWI
jgi:capsule biosynthesis phosphatase